MIQVHTYDNIHRKKRHSIPCCNIPFTLTFITRAVISVKRKCHFNINRITLSCFVLTIPDYDQYKLKCVYSIRSAIFQNAYIRSNKTLERTSILRRLSNHGSPSTWTSYSKLSCLQEKNNFSRCIH